VIAQGDWCQAEALADRASTVLRQAGIERLLPCAVQARVAIHKGDLATVRQQLVRAQRLRPASTYGQPHLAVQARVELIRVHLALADITGARTLMQEIEEILRHRPGLGTLVGHVKQLQARLGEEHGDNAPGASALTAAELHLLPLLCTHMTVPEIAVKRGLVAATLARDGTVNWQRLVTTPSTPANPAAFARSSPVGPFSRAVATPSTPSKPRSWCSKTIPYSTPATAHI